MFGVKQLRERWSARRVVRERGNKNRVRVGNLV